MITINTKRLILEPSGTKYLKTVHEYASDMENTKYMEHLPNETMEETMNFLKDVDMEWASGSPAFYEFAIIYENQHVGAVSIYINDDLSGELGWIVNKKYWKQGIAYEAAKTLLDYAIRELGIRHFIAHCDAENVASYKTMEKLGMQRTSAHGGRKNRASDEERTEYQYELYIPSKSK